MSILATCPNNPDHKRFSTSAHVVEDWIVDEHGNFLANGGCTEVMHGPRVDNTWTCCECLAEAEVKEIR